MIDIKKGNLFIITAASGAGKTSLVKALTHEVKNLGVSVSYTTRQPREGEKNGVDYFFVKPEIFNKMHNEGAFLETAQAHGENYGTAKQAVKTSLDIGQNLILEIDYQGAFHVKKIFKHVVSIFILPPSMLILEERLNFRDKDSKENIQKRLSVARHEMSHLDKFDYVIINDDFEKAVADLKSIIVMDSIAEDLKTEKQIISYRVLIESLKI